MDAFNTLRIVMAMRGFLTVVLSLFGGDDDKAPPHAAQPVQTTVTRRLETDGSVVVETRQRMADGSETKSLEIVSTFVK